MNSRNQVLAVTLKVQGGERSGKTWKSGKYQGNDLALEKSGKLRKKNLETWKYQGNDFDPGKS